MFFNKKEQWKMKLYYLGIHVKTINIQENELIFNNVYPVTILFKKFIFKTNIATIVLHPTSSLKLDREKKVWYVETEIYRGVKHD